ncbi:LRR receptor-like serine/threonine-protein kinase FLS2 [Hordeum vulgare]|nr:LRR receptor-like serine/threonine-protein kinase FLS2 [Hordeum vulgare]
MHRVLGLIGQEVLVQPCPDGVGGGVSRGDNVEEIPGDGGQEPQDDGVVVVAPRRIGHAARGDVADVVFGVVTRQHQMDVVAPAGEVGAVEGELEVEDANKARRKRWWRSGGGWQSRDGWCGRGQREITGARALIRGSRCAWAQVSGARGVYGNGGGRSRGGVSSSGGIRFRRALRGGRSGHVGSDYQAERCIDHGLSLDGLGYINRGEVPTCRALSLEVALD